MKVFIAAGRTGGHVYPAMTVARDFKNENLEIFWFGNQKSLEEKICEEENFNFIKLSSRGFLKKNYFEKIKALIYLIQAFLKVLLVFIKHKPDLLFVTGGFISLAPGLVAYFLRIPLFIQEQNSIPGLSNRILHNFSKLTFSGFPESFKKYPDKVIFTGNPVREDIKNYKKIADKESGKGNEFKILVLGGSQGSSQLNDIILESLKKIEDINHLIIIHQTGKKEKIGIQERYKELGVNSTVKDYITDMGFYYSQADLIISRAGAMTISEICTLGKASILLPLPWSADNHQYHNAMYLKEREASEVIESTIESSEDLALLIGELRKDSKRRLLLEKNAKNLFNTPLKTIHKLINESITK